MSMELSPQKCKALAELACLSLAMLEKTKIT
jgi:hypothetical protein